MRLKGELRAAATTVMVGFAWLAGLVIGRVVAVDENYQVIVGVSVLFWVCAIGWLILGVFVATEEEQP